MISENNDIKTNSIEAWILAARPKTLSGAAVPVMIGAAWAFKTGGWENFQVLPAILCFLFAFFMQIDSNFINDYFDCVKGNDDKTTRLGPKRACAEGWITLKAMRHGLVVTSLLSCLVGLPLVFYGGLPMIIVGAACVLFAFLYTTYFSYVGLGDLLVLVFFGIVPVTFTYYVILPASLQSFDPYVILTGFATGLVVDTLLVVNNFRDRDNDRRDGKNTLVVRIGEEHTITLYNWLGLIAFFLIFNIIILEQDKGWIAVLLFVLLYTPYSLLHESSLAWMKIINKGRNLNKVLGMTARDILVFGITTTLAILLF